MKAAIYNPYLDTLGGGEKYTIEFAITLSENGYDVDVEWHDTKILELLSSRFGLNLPKNIRVVNSIQKGKDYDLCFWVSDGSIPNLLSRRNFLHFQVPFMNVNGRSLINKMKLFKIEKVICNSNFTKKVVDNEFGVNSYVLYPPIDVTSFKPKRKENIILYVGRFSKLLQNKGQEVLIEGFKKLYNSGIKDYKLVLAGGVEVGTDIYMASFEKSIKNYPIEIIKSPKFSELKNLFGKARIFWSASGFNINEEKNPEKVEHFGMTLVESMSAGCVPVVVNIGGHKEIIEDGISGFLWSKKSNLLSKTLELINNEKLLTRTSRQSIVRSKIFTKQLFQQRIKKDILLFQ